MYMRHLASLASRKLANPPPLIAQAIAQAHLYYGPYTDLDVVTLPLFPVGGYVQGYDFCTLLKDAFASDLFNWKRPGI